MIDKSIMKKCMWVILVILISFLLIWKCQNAADTIRIYQDITFSYYVSLFWEIIKVLTILLPIWLLSLLGLARSFFGENWFPFIERIPIHVTKSVIAAATVLLVCVSVVGAVYSVQTKDSYIIQYMMENRFDGWKTMLAWMVYYGVLLYIEQRCIQRKCSRQNTRKKQVWITVTIFLTYIILVFFDCMNLWYIPLDQVGNLNALEDYTLWWFSLFCAVFLFPFWFLSARKTVRLFKDKQWLTLSVIIPKQITALIALVVTELMIWQIQESRYYRTLGASMDVPEYAEAAVTGHAFQAMMWGLALFYTLCLLVKQIRAARRSKHEQ